MKSHVENEVSRAEQLLASRDEKARWEGAALLSEFAETSPELVWPLVACFGCSHDADVRSAIATCVLEFHFNRYFPEVERLAAFSPDFAETVSLCWPFGQTEHPENKARFDALVQATRTV